MVVGTDQQEEGKERDIKKLGREEGGREEKKEGGVWELEKKRPVVTHAHYRHNAVLNICILCLFSGSTHCLFLSPFLSFTLTPFLFSVGSIHSSVLG